MKKFIILGLSVATTGAALGQTYFTGFEATESPTWNPLSSTPFLGPWGSSQGTPFGVVTTTTAQSRTPAFVANQGSQVATLNITSSVSNNYNATSPQFNPGVTTFQGFGKFSVGWKMYIDSANTGGASLSTRQFGIQINGIRDISNAASTFSSTFMIDEAGGVFTQKPGDFSTTQLGTVTGLNDKWVDFNVLLDATSRKMVARINGQAFTILDSSAAVSTAGITANARGWSFALYSRGVGSTSNQGLGRVYWDSVQVAPEPASMAAIAVGAFGLIARRRKKNS